MENAIEQLKQLRDKFVAKGHGLFLPDVQILLAGIDKLIQEAEAAKNV